MYVYRDSRASLSTEARTNLSAVADLKVRQISAWLAERHGNAAARAAHRPLHGAGLRGLAEGRDPRRRDGAAAARAAGWLRDVYGWSEVTVLDPAGHVRLALGREHCRPAWSALVREAMGAEAIRFVDLHGVVEARARSRWATWRRC